MGAEQQKQMPVVPEKTMKCKYFLMQSKSNSIPRKFKLLDVSTLGKNINLITKAKLLIVI